MRVTQSLLRRWLPIVGLAVLFSSQYAGAQVSPAEIRNPQLKALEQEYMSQLIAFNKEISTTKFPFAFLVDRYVGLDPEAQVGSDRRGLEFVRFHSRVILKLSGNYNAAFASGRVSRNQRANHVLDEVIVPILQKLPKYFGESADFDGFGFEIGYHVLDKTSGVHFEGKETVVVLFSREDALRYLQAADASEKQQILNASEVYLSGERFGLALGKAEPLSADELEDADPAPAAVSGPRTGTPGVLLAASPRAPKGDARPMLDLRIAGQSRTPVTHAEPATPQAAPPPPADVNELQAKYQAELDALAKEGAARFHFVEYAPPSLVNFRDALYLQVTLRNASPFDREKTSLYKRAAQSFDLFLGPQLKDLLAKVPSIPSLAGLNITVLQQFASNAPSSEAVEYVIPLASLRRFTDYKITNQDLLDQSLVLVNGVRVALNLQQVE